MALCAACRWFTSLKISRSDRPHSTIRPIQSHAPAPSTAGAEGSESSAVGCSAFFCSGVGVRLAAQHSATAARIRCASK